ncbi:MAG: hypothetical protein ACO3T8_05245 [Candidatus Nanopelagicales bacterium]
MSPGINSNFAGSFEMILQALSNLISSSKPWVKSRNEILQSHEIYLNSTPGFDSFLVADISNHEERNKYTVAIFATDRLAEKFEKEINNWDFNISTLYFPALETLPHETIKQTLEVV